jgi:hypothetical protein
MSFGGAPVVRAEYPLGDGRGRADIYADGHLDTGEKWSLVVEIKVDAVEADEQLDKYYLDGPNALHVFLTPSGRDGKTAQCNRPWALMSFLDMAEAFVHHQARLTKQPGAPFLALYLTGVLTGICGVVCDPNLERVLAQNNLDKLERLLGAIHDHVE